MHQTCTPASIHLYARSKNDCAPPKPKPVTGAKKRRQSKFLNRKMDEAKHERKGKWHKVHTKSAKKDKRTARQDPIPDTFESEHQCIPQVFARFNKLFLEESSTPTTITAPQPIAKEQHEPEPNVDQMYTQHGYIAIIDYYESSYCTSCASCKAQHETNTVWLTENKARLSKEEEVYNEEWHRREEEEQERREHYDWTYRNKHW